MNWLNNFVRPKIRAVLKKKSDTPDNLWDKCEGCGQLVYHREFRENFFVCTHCEHHHRIGPKERFEMLFDEGDYSLVPLPEFKDDPLKFRDKKRYSDRLKESRSKTGDKEAICVAHGKMGGIETVLAAQNFHFMAGSMGAAVGEGFLVAAETAVKRKSPLIAITAAGGARMQEGIISLMQMPRTTVAVEKVRDAGLPYIAVLTDPTTGGVTASFAMLGDIQIAEPGALIGFAGPRVIENTIREKLPNGFQRSEYLLEHGMIDMVVDRSDLRETLIRVVSLLMIDEMSSGESRRVATERDIETEPSDL